MLIRRAHVLLLAAGAAATAVLLVHAAAAPAPAPGRFLTWAANATAEPSAAPTMPLAPPSPTPDGGGFGGLQIPLQSMLQGLNADTAATAQGQYGLLQQLEAAVGDRINSFLAGVGAGH